MADGTTLNPGTGGDLIATDDIGGTKHQQVKVEYGADGTATPVDATNPLPTVLPPLISTANSSTATLGIGGVFTGTSEDVSAYAIIHVAVRASHASATDGLSVQQSTDATNWDFLDVYTIPAATGKVFTFQPAARYFRVVYTNGGVAQSSFRLQTIFHRTYTKTSSQRPTDAFSNENDFVQVWAVTSVWNGATWDRLAGNTSGAFAQGNVAHDVTEGGNPVGIGATAIAYGTNPTGVTAGDRTRLYANRAGVQLVIGGHPNVQTFRTRFTAAQTDVALVSVSAGTKIVLTRLTVTLDNASTVFPSVLIGFGTANTPTTTAILDHPGVPAGGGVNIGDGSGILGVGADDADLRITTVGTATGLGMAVSGSYHTIES